jgi:hypothetical protein
MLSYKKVINTEPFHYLFHLPLSEEAYAQMLPLDLRVNNQQVTTEDDVWTYIWGNPHFSSQKSYKHLVGHAELHPTYKWLWHSE